MSFITTLCGEPRSSLPHPPFSKSQILALENAFREAWRRLCARGKRPLLDSSEDQITEWLVDILEEVRIEGVCAGFNCDVFLPPNRESSYRNYNSSSIDKQPDLIFGLAGRPRQGTLYPRHARVFVECKIIDDTRTVALYAGKGLVRFLNGDYAWAMPHAMMVAYVRNAKRLPAALADHLYKKSDGVANTVVYQVKSMPTRCSFGTASPETYLTIHERKWRYPDFPVSPGDITIRHLWVVV